MCMLSLASSNNSCYFVVDIACVDQSMPSSISSSILSVFPCPANSNPPTILKLLPLFTDDDGENKKVTVYLQVTAVILKDGKHLAADMVVVGIGIRANTSLFEGQLLMEKRGLKVNGQMQTSDSSVYAVGDVAAFPIKLFDGDIRRLEHVDSARRTARHAVTAILEPSKTRDVDYLPFFYSRVFTLSWQFYGDNVGEVVHYGDFTSSSPRFGAYWVGKGQIMGAFLEGGSREEYEALSVVVRRKAKVSNMSELEKQGLTFAIQESKKDIPESGVTLGKNPTYAWYATAGVVAAVSISAFGYWYGRKRRRW